MPATPVPGELYCLTFKYIGNAMFLIISTGHLRPVLTAQEQLLALTTSPVWLTDLEAHRPAGFVQTSIIIWAMLYV